MTHQIDMNVIDELTEELGQLQGKAQDQQACARFIGEHGADLLAVLADYKLMRAQAETEGLSRLVKEAREAARIIIEGYSADSMQDAFSQALHKTAQYFSELHDISVTVLGLAHLPEGGYCATLEVHITPMTTKDTKHPEGQDLELKHIRERDYLKRRKHDEEHLKDLVYDHFITTAGYAPSIPDYFLINIRDAELVNHMIEKEFFRASNMPTKDELIRGEYRIVVKNIKPTPDGSVES